MTATVADWMVQSIARRGTGFVFLVPGYLVGPINESLSGDRGIKPIVCAHELGAAYMADGYARLSGRPGVAVGISGPGASNMLTAAIAAAADKVPVLYLTGNVPRPVSGKGAFQDGGERGTRDRALFAEALGNAWECHVPDDLTGYFQKAWRALEGSPPAPCFLSVPRDLQAEIWREPPASGPLPAQAAAEWSEAAWLSGIEGLANRAGKIALLVGESTTSPGFAAALLRLVERYALPVATTVPAKGVIPESHPLSLGAFGYGGTPRANNGLLRGDLEGLLVVGADFNERNTLHWHRELLRPRPGLRLMPWPAATPFGEMQDVVGDGALALTRLAESEGAAARALQAGCAIRKTWIGELVEIPRLAAPAPRNHDEGVHPAEIVRVMRASLPETTVLFVDAGMCRRVIGQYWTCAEPQRLFTCPVTAPMGWGLAASIGAQLARPDRPVVTIAGDGSMLMHGLELATAVRYDVPVIWVINNNGGLGTVYLRSESAAAAAMATSQRIAWASFAKLLGAEGYEAASPEELEQALSIAIRQRKPTVIDVRGSLEFASDDPFFGKT